MANFTLTRFVTPNASVVVSEGANDQSTTAALGQAAENLDTYALRLNGTNALTSAGTIDASAASATTGLKLPSAAGAAPTAAGALAWDSTALNPVFGDGTITRAGAMFRIADTTLGAAATNITLSSIPGTFKHLRLVIQSRGDGATANEKVLMQFNADTGSNYDYQQSQFTNATTAFAATAAQASAGVAQQPGASVTRGAIAGAATVTIPNYASTTFEKSFHGESGFADSTAANSFFALYAGSWRNTAAITSIKLFPASSTNFAAGTRVSLYGEN